jgi:hypothetical protein
VATQPLIAPTPKYAIGDTIYVATTERTVDQLQCPDCLGSGKWTVFSPAGGEYTTTCPRCQSTYSFSENLPSLKVERWVGKAQARLITGMEINAVASGWREAVEYHSTTGTSSWYTIKEADAFGAEADAQAVADAQAAEKNVAVEASPEVLTSRHFSSLTLDQGRWDQFKNGIWNTQYHAGALLQKVREALNGEDGNEEKSVPDIIESLRDAARWDFKYHLDNLPLTPLVTAALASDDITVKAAADALPDTMRLLLSGAFSEEALSA